ncbi:hypothetical protein SOVF_040190 [Spinacia oleracea]|nr:hypothetical protein SOVF_040190 [Spinacia oleracea]
MITVSMLIIGFQVYACWEQERTALLFLKATAENSDRFFDWNDDRKSDCCKWDGVTCAANKRIISLSLGFRFESEKGWHFNVSNFLPFQQLQGLDLMLNSVASWTRDKGSKKLSSLQNLVSLNLTACNLTNSVLSELSGFPSLKYLNLEANQLMGSIQLHDIEAISKNLEELYLRNNYISSIRNDNDCVQKHKFQKLQGYGNTSCFSGLPSLRVLDLSYNKLAGEIPLWLQNLTTLETLDLSENQFVGNIGSSSLVHVLSLEYLALSNNHLVIPGSFQSFASHTKLKYFIADSNHLVHEVSNRDIQPFTHGLHILSLSNCALFAYPRFLYDQRDLRIIDLSDNTLHGEFPLWILENNSRLDTLILRNTSLSGSLQLSSVSSHANINLINIAQNKLQGHIPANIAVVFPKLIHLDLSNNAFEGNIPSILCDLKSLEILHLSNNHLSGGIEHISKSCINLISLDLSNNNCRGELPTFQSLSKLQSLNLQGNYFSGELKSIMFGPSQTLTTLLLSNNSLEGSIPNELCNVSKYPSLTVLDLSFNKLNGALPNCSISVFYLLLNNNRLSGQITDSFCNNSWLVHLDLSNNDLSGHIPTAVGNLTNLNILLLKGNQFYGQVPVELCRLLNLIVLDLSSNSLYGHIPACLGQISFDSSDSGFNSMGFSFSTEIPIGILAHMITAKGDSTHNIFHDKVEITTKSNTYSYIGDMLLYISGIDLSCNRLTGQIPDELGNLSNLNALNLSHNKLWGSIPTTISNLYKLESLDFSYNHLNGSIPTSLTTLNSLAVFKFSFQPLMPAVTKEISSFAEVLYPSSVVQMIHPPSQIQLHPKMVGLTSKHFMSAFRYLLQLCFLQL